MATVYLAEDTSLHRKVAIKVLAERYAEDEQFVERFRREAQSAAGLNHPNIVAIYDRGVAEGTYYIAMEYLDGPTLKDVIDERGGLEPNRAIGFATQILAALALRAQPRRRAPRHQAAQRRSSRPTAGLKVTDFGIARAGASQMTEVGSIVGTAQYLSPEQARGEVVGPPSDLYSVGIVLYEMLTGRVPFEGDSAVAIAMKHLSEEPVPPSVYAPGDASCPRAGRAARAGEGCGRPLPDCRGDVGRSRPRAPRRCALARTEQMTRVIAPGAWRRSRRACSRRASTRVWDREETPPARRPPPPAPVRPKRSRWPWVLLALLVLAAGAVAAVALTGVIGGGGGRGTTTTTPPAFVRVPTGLVGTDQFSAADQIVSRGLKAVRINRESPQDPGKVIGVRPVGGQRLRRGSTVTLLVSKGVTNKTVPTLTDLTLQDATALLQQHGLVLGDQSEKNDLADAGNGDRAGSRRGCDRTRRIVGRT